MAPLYFDRKQSLRDSAIETARVLHRIWSRKGKNPQIVYRAADKLANIFKEYLTWHRKRNMSGVKIRQRRIAYLHNLHQTVDIERQVKNEVNAISVEEEIEVDDIVCNSDANISTVLESSDNYFLRRRPMQGGNDSLNGDANFVGAGNSIFDYGDGDDSGDEDGMGTFET